jgi:catechol 2,3-dioxygenase-like lactoylglutathione lyase family enzyme
MSHVVPMLWARDLEATIRFYTDILGFIVTNRMALADGRPGWCYLLRGAAALMFYTDAPFAAPAMTGAVYFYPRDVAAEWERLRDRVEVVRPLARMDYGMREFTIRDPNGYELRFGQEL